MNQRPHRLYVLCSLVFNLSFVNGGLWLNSKQQDTTTILLKPWQLNWWHDIAVKSKQTYFGWQRFYILSSKKSSSINFYLQFSADKIYVLFLALGVETFFKFIIAKYKAVFISFMVFGLTHFYVLFLFFGWDIAFNW